ncbi:hypothetical protein Taro_016673 [Colocasia esculenta]|uniref:S1 motif domain-containing protein n=1 Tax=Colocasia esculenta TaxID=4460 RepID=A0A843UL09_COLES|nr:hypothetical protein [Colocasia esculenta]
MTPKGAPEEHESSDWRRAEDLLQTGERAEAELISCSSSGFVVSFGSLIGFLPYRTLGAKWKFLAFESWLRKKGLDPSIYRQNLSIMGSYEVQKSNLVDSSQNLTDGFNDKDKLAPDMKLEELFHMYDQEKNKFLSSFVGQMIRVSVVFVDQKSRKLVFSGKPKEKQEMVERKRNLMARLSVGDVVKCCITKITFFGIFVEPDPLNEALESVIGGGTSLDGRLVTAQADEEWADVESLIKELQQIDGVQGVTKGRFFLSPGQAPTFQVYMASMHENQYKLLARYGNKVQEVLVQSSLDKEQMKATILTCTNRVV